MHYVCMYACMHACRYVCMYVNVCVHDVCMMCVHLTLREAPSGGKSGDWTCPTCGDLVQLAQLQQHLKTFLHPLSRFCVRFSSRGQAFSGPCHDICLKP